MFYFAFQVEQNRMKLLNDKAVATSQLQKKLGQLLYLTNLEKVLFLKDVNFSHVVLSINHFIDSLYLIC